MVVPKVTWTDLLSWSWFSSCCRTRWLVATLSCVSLAELNESPSFLPCICLMRVGPKRCCAAAGRSERQPYCSSHSEGHTHTMFLVQVHCHLLDGSLNGSAMILPFSAPTFYWTVLTPANISSGSILLKQAPCPAVVREKWWVVFVCGWMDKEEVVFTYSGLFFNHEKEGHGSICNNVDGLWRRYAKWKKPDRER